MARKVDRENLTVDQTREVVKAYNESSTPQEKDLVLQTPHPRTAGYSFTDEMSWPRHEKAKVDPWRVLADLWGDEPDVKNYTEAIRAFRDAIAAAANATKKFSPEAGRFVATRHKKIRKELQALEKAL